MDEKLAIEEAKDEMKIMFSKAQGESTEAYELRKEAATKLIDQFDDTDLAEFKTMIGRLSERELHYKHDEVHLSGALNELFYRKQYISENPERAIRSDLNMQLVHVLAGKAARYFDLNDKSRPDLFDLVYDEKADQYIIKHAIEVTHGVIGESKVKQLTSYSEDIVEILAMLKDAPETLKHMGFGLLAENIGKFVIADDFSIEVVLSAEKDPNEMHTFLPFDLDADLVDDVRDLNDEQVVSFSNSLFTKDELAKMSVALFKHIN